MSVSARAVGWVLLGLLTLPVSWPIWSARNAWRLRAYARCAQTTARAARAWVEAEGLSRVRGARERVLTHHSMASGIEETALLELVLDDGTTRVIDEGDPSFASLRAALSAQHRLRTIEAHAPSLGSVFGWGLWLASVLALGAFATGSTLGWILAGLVAGALVAFTAS